MRFLKFLYIGVIFSMLSCGGGGSDDGDGGTPPPPPAPPAPEASMLIFPENNTECNISDVVSETQSTVPFQWNASENTDTYQITVRNLNTNVIAASPIVTDTEAMITLERGTPYEWIVTSRSNTTNATATSAIFRFFNEGPGIENFAPFPAVAIAPRRGENLANTTTMVELIWEGTDIDNETLSFDIFFGTSADDMPMVSSSTENSFGVDVVSGQTYFWRIISNDTSNNNSQSEIFQFRVN